MSYTRDIGATVSVIDTKTPTPTYLQATTSVRYSYTAAPPSQRVTSLSAPAPSRRSKSSSRSRRFCGDDFFPLLGDGDFFFCCGRGCADTAAAAARTPAASAPRASLPAATATRANSARCAPSSARTTRATSSARTSCSTAARPLRPSDRKPLPARGPGLSSGRKYPGGDAQRRGQRPRTCWNADGTRS